jgi:hypothetical protein
MWTTSPRGEVGGSDVEPAAGVGLDKAGDQIDPAAGLEQMMEDRVLVHRAQRDRRRQVLQRVPGQRQLGKQDQVCPGSPGLLGQRQMLLEIDLHLSQAGIDLRQGERQAAC